MRDARKNLAVDIAEDGFEGLWLRGSVLRQRGKHIPWFYLRENGKVRSALEVIGNPVQSSMAITSKLRSCGLGLLVGRVHLTILPELVLGEANGARFRWTRDENSDY